MESLDNIKGLIKKLHLKASADLDRRVHEDISRGSAKIEQLKSAGAQPAMWRMVMKTKTAKFTIAAVAALVVIGGITFWPGRGADDKQWWLAPPAAWSQEIIDSLDTFKCVTCREQLIDVRPDGSERTLSWMKQYSANDRYRRDWYGKDKDVIGEIHWNVPDGSDMVQYTVRFDSESYSIGRRTGVVSSGSQRDPVEGLRSCVEDLEKADRHLGTEVIEGRKCVGFEIDKEVGSTRVWFDVETRLPVRTEFRNQPRSPGSERRITMIRDQYDYDVDVPPETFVPHIPEGFVPYQPGESQIDIAIMDENLTVTEQPDGSFKAEIAIYNNGPDPSPKFDVEFYAVDPDKGERFLARQAAGPIMPGDHVLCNQPGLKLRTNEDTITVVVSSRNKFPELNKMNNMVSKVIPGRQAEKPETSEKPKEGRMRHFVRLVVGEDKMTFQGLVVSWEELPGLLEKVPDRHHTVFQIATDSRKDIFYDKDKKTTSYSTKFRISRQLASDLCYSYGFEYLSSVGVHPLRSTGGPSCFISDEK